MTSNHEINGILEIQSKIFTDTTSMLYSTLNKRIDELTTVVLELQHHIKISSEEKKEIQNEVKQLKDQAENNSKVIAEQKTVIEAQKKRLNKIEDYSRINNIRIDGVDKAQGESKENLQLKAQKVLENKLQLKNVAIDNIHRLPTKERTGPRTIIARLSSHSTRDTAIKNTWRLKNTGIFINEDLCEDTRKERKEKLPLLKSARESGKIAYFRRSQLVIHERHVKKEPKDSSVNTSQNSPEFSGVKTLNSSQQLNVASLVAQFTPNDSNVPSSEPGEENEELPSSPVLNKKKQNLRPRNNKKYIFPETIFNLLIFIFNFILINHPYIVYYIYI